jgi:hypothetical protein
VKKREKNLFVYPSFCQSSNYVSQNGGRMSFSLSFRSALFSRRFLSTTKTISTMNGNSDQVCVGFFFPTTKKSWIGFLKKKNTDQQYQQQQLAQLRQETSSESSSNTTEQQPSERPWTDQGLNEKIVQKIRSSIDNGRHLFVVVCCSFDNMLILSGKLIASDVDNRVSEQLRSLPDDAASIESVFNEFNTSDLTGVVNKSAFLCNLIKQWKLRNPQPTRSSVAGDYQPSEGGFGDASGGTPGSGTHKPGPDEAKLKVKNTISH